LDSARAETGKGQPNVNEINQTQRGRKVTNLTERRLACDRNTEASEEAPESAAPVFDKSNAVNAEQSVTNETNQSNR
jgi:hypothetical protein